MIVKSRWNDTWYGVYFAQNIVYLIECTSGGFSRCCSRVAAKSCRMNSIRIYRGTLVMTQFVASKTIHV